MYMFKKINICGNFLSDINIVISNTRLCVCGCDCKKFLLRVSFIDHMVEFYC